jgi:predicted hotdog family 3-hydroxylacyl-ACP dehydratase
MLVTRTQLAKLIPHEGDMCLLDGVLRWDAVSIQCVSRSHRDARNPLRTEGGLRALCGIEYAAQAMAVHGALAGGRNARPRAGYLASLRDIVCGVEWLDRLDGELIVDAERLAGSAGPVIYRFSMRVGEAEVLRGRATVVLDAGDAAP